MIDTLPIPEDIFTKPIFVTDADINRVVGFSTCKECGAAVLIDPRSATDGAGVHLKMHRELVTMLNRLAVGL